MLFKTAEPMEYKGMAYNGGELSDSDGIGIYIVRLTMDGVTVAMVRLAFPYEFDYHNWIFYKPNTPRSK